MQPVSGRDLFREGMSAGNEPVAGSSRQMSQLGQSQRLRVPPPPPPPPPPAAVVSSYTHRTLYDYQAAGDDELSFNAGANLKVMSQDDQNWWQAEDEMGTRGLVPSNYLAPL
jgi:hypothetical protein